MITSMLQLQFLDKSIINALVPAFSLMPDKLVFLYDVRNVSKKHTKDIEEALKRRLPNLKVSFTEVDRFNINAIEECILSCIKTAQDKVCIDITGGPELMIAGGFVLGMEHDVKIVYTNLAQGYIYDVKNGKKEADIVHMCVEDYLQAIGAKRYASSHSEPEEEEYAGICKIAEYMFEHISEWHALQSYLSEKFKDNTTMNFRVTDRLPYNGQEYSPDKLLKMFAEHGFIKKDGSGGYLFGSTRYREYLINYGIWLEMYIYIKGREYFDESYLGFVIDWNDSDSIDTNDNEIDVLAMKNSIPIFISCKMKKPAAAEIFEVAFLADRLGGPEAKGLMATTYPVANDNWKPSGIYQRFKKMKVGYIESKNFKFYTPEEIFKTALKCSE